MNLRHAQSRVRMILFFLSVYFSEDFSEISALTDILSICFSEDFSDTVTAEAVFDTELGDCDAVFVVRTNIRVPSVEFGAGSGLSAPFFSSHSSRDINRFAFDIFSYLADQFSGKHVLCVYVAYSFTTFRNMTIVITQDKPGRNPSASCFVHEVVWAHITAQPVRVQPPPSR